jgi:7-carboxy-7-deazaguanine synthase
MFGHNTPRRKEGKDTDLQVQSVFSTIQGEGPFAGDPAIFIRLTGCNLRCWFCDTEWDDENDSRISDAEIARLASDARCDDPTDLVVITGGEPCRQELWPLFVALRLAGFKRLQIETAGSFWQECLTADDVTVIVSPKTLGVHPNFRLINAHWKYVINAGQVSDEDGLPTGSTQRGQKNLAVARPPIGAPVYLQPCDEYEDAKNSANMKAMLDSAMKYGYRAGLQLHKFFGMD